MSTKVDTILKLFKSDKISAEDVKKQLCEDISKEIYYDTSSSDIIGILSEYFGDYVIIND